MCDVISIAALILSGCAEPASDTALGAGDSAAPVASEALPFDARRLLLRSLSTGVDQAGLTAFAWTADDAPQAPQLELSLLDDRGFVDGDPAWRCDWSASIEDLGPTEPAVSGSWSARRIHLIEQDTDCDPAPAVLTTLTTEDLALELGPVGSRGGPLSATYADSTPPWPDLQPAALGIWLGWPGQPFELAYGFVYAADAGLVLERDPDPRLLALDGALPTGIVCGTGYGGDPVAEVLP